MLVVAVLGQVDGGAVPLVSPVLAVSKVITDQLRVDTGPVITAELARLLHGKVKVEGSVDLAGVRAVEVEEVPRMKT